MLLGLIMSKGIPSIETRLKARVNVGYETLNNDPYG